MPISVTSQQVLALAPDDSSVKAARSLATPKPWSHVGQNDRSIWGACQGSGKDPYLTQVDWEGPAFKCSCPSRKFPCKHGLALLLLLAEQPALFSNQQEPDWVKAWIASRQQKEGSKASREAAPVDEVAKAKRQERRSARVSEGMDLLELWLRDLVQQGLSSAPGKHFAFWDQAAARLVDAQAPGTARWVRELGSIAVSGSDWSDRMLRAIGRLVLLIQAHRRIDELPQHTQMDVRAAIGLPMAQDEVLAQPPMRDRWLIVGQRVQQEDRIRTQRTWLVGQNTNQKALILEFAAGNAGFETSYVPGSSIDASLCFFPGAVPLRALIKQIHANPEKTPELFGAAGIDQNCSLASETLSQNPWIETQLLLLKSVIPLAAPHQWLIADQQQAALPCRTNYPLLAFSAGSPVDLAGEWDGVALRPLGAFAGGRYIPLGQAA